MRVSTTLRRADPLGGERVELSARGRAELRALIGPDDHEPMRTPVARSRPWVRLVTLTTAAIVAVAMLVLPGLWHGTATAEAQDLLDRAIAAAYDPPARADQYWKVTSNSITSDIIGEGGWGDPDAVSVLRHVRRVEYVAVDGSRPTWFEDRAGPYVRQVSGPATTLPDVGWGSPERWTSNLSPRDEGSLVFTLPTDPDQLRAELYRRGQGSGASDDEAAFTGAADILRTGYAPAALRAALLQVLKTIPGVDVVNHDVTLDGRPGVALGRPEPNRNGQRHELVFDRGTAEFIGERYVFTTPDATIETAVSRTLVDRVDPTLVRTAVRMVCTMEASGSVCREP
ncbi:CU044_5270 family protein [Micropruina sp.]|uniref:CU044_5270 family protein n=1 Tax=Micropruina sp. TaxID=2737536 RepID=UPI0039E46777